MHATELFFWGSEGGTDEGIEILLPGLRIVHDDCLECAGFEVLDVDAVVDGGEDLRHVSGI